MSSSEAYLDSLLAALNGESKKESEPVISEPIIEEPTVEEMTVEESLDEEIINVEGVETEEEPVITMPVSDDPNKALGADEIAALFAQANMDVETGESLEEPENEEDEVEEVEEVEVEESVSVEPESVEPEEEPITIMPISDDPNKALGADEIAALFAQANMDVETGELLEEPENEEDEVEEVEVEESVTVEPESVEPESVEPEEEPITIMPVSDDPNKALGADEIAALFAQANMDVETGELLEEPENEEVEVEEVEVEESVTVEPESVEPEEEPITIMPVSDDPNKALGADEIAALFAQANVDIETGDALAETDVHEEKETEEPAAFDMEGMSLEDMLAQMMDEEDAETTGNQETEETTEDSAEEEIKEVEEEIEIDMDNPEELELLLGLGERPDWSTKKAETEMSAQDEDELLASMGEENPDLNEINSLLNKLDNNELVGDGIEESVLVGFDESEYDEDQDPWLEELLGNTEGKKKKEKVKKEKKKFSLFGKKKKEVEEENPQEEFVPGFYEDTSPQEAEEVTDILQAFAEDSSDIPFDLFAEVDGDGAEETDLIALVEADEKKQSKKKNKKDDEKKGFFAKMLDVLTEEIPEDEEEVKKEKKVKKDKKGKKKPVTDADDNEGILEELDAEGDGKKGKKDKKEKKAKKEKKKKAPKQMDDDSVLEMVKDAKKLPMKMVVRIFALCISIMALILLVNHFVPKLWSLADARNAFYKQDYETTYQEMSGKELSESDQRLYEKSKMILQLNHKVDAYTNYKEMDMPVEALDSLLSGYLLWQQLGEKIAEYDAVTETEEIKTVIVNALSADYQISEEEAIQINSLGNYEYTLRLEEITGSLSRQNSTFYSVEEEVPMQEEIEQQEVQQPQEPTENVLSEEEVQW